MSDGEVVSEGDTIKQIKIINPITMSVYRADKTGDDTDKS